MEQMRINVPEGCTARIEQENGLLIVSFEQKEKEKSEEWERLFDMVKPYQNRLVPLFILRPHAFDVDAFRFAVKVSATTVPIYVDTANIFIRNNSKLSAIPMLHTFVVDEQNRVVLIGDPLRNLEIQQLLVNLLKN